jgi:hypothetical protein
MKEDISILLASNQVFNLWSTILLAWEEGRILGGTCSSPSNPIPIGKSALSPLIGLSESQFIDLANELLAQKVALQNRPMEGGDPHVKTMPEWSFILQHKNVIRHEIMVHHGFLKLTSLISTYTMKE